LLQGDRVVALVVCELVPFDRRHVEFIRTVRRRRPRLPVAVIAGSAADLADLYGTPEVPVLVVPAPVRPAS
jgi:hypothetical protein